MLHLIIPIGTIVKTDYKPGIQLLLNILNEDVAQNLKNLMPQISELAQAFNLGKLEEADFLDKIMSLLKLPKEQTQAFLEAWNAMCVLDDEADTTLRALAEAKMQRSLNFHFISDTNPIHYRRLSHALKTVGIDPACLHTTFENQGASKAAIVQRILEENEIKENAEVGMVLNVEALSPDRWMMVVGNVSNIDDPILRADYEEKHQAVLQVTTQRGCAIIQLKVQQRFTAATLLDTLAMHPQQVLAPAEAPDLSQPLAFSQQGLAVVQPNILASKAPQPGESPEFEPGVNPMQESARPDF